jgi:hypothetical protein
MGLLDDIVAAGQSGASPFSALYPSQLPAPRQQPMITSSEFDQGIMQPPDPFGPPPQQTAAPPRSVFDPPPRVAQMLPAPANSTSIQSAVGNAPNPLTGQQPPPVAPQNAAAPTPTPPPMPTPIPTPRPAAAPPRAPLSLAPANYGQDRNIPIGNYQMPSFGSAGGATPSSPSASPGANPSVGDRLMAGLSGAITNAHTGPIGALLGGIGGIATGQRSDPQAVRDQRDNLTTKALAAKGASPDDIGAALGNPAIMNALVARYYGRTPQLTPGAAGGRYTPASPPAAPSFGGLRAAPGTAPGNPASNPASGSASRPTLRGTTQNGLAWSVQ